MVNSGRLIIPAVVVTVLLFALQTWWSISQDRAQSIANEVEAGRLAVRLLEEHAKVTFRFAARDLDHLIRRVRDIDRVGARITENSVRDVLTRSQPYNNVLKALQYVGPSGQAYVSSIDYPAYQTDADDRTYVPFLLKHPDFDALKIGTPFRRFYDGELIVPVARNMHSIDDVYLGLVSTDISITYFDSVYFRLARENSALVSFYTRDGTLIVRSPFDDKFVGKNISSEPTFKLIERQCASGVGRTNGDSLVDDSFLGDGKARPRLYVFRCSDEYPITTVFARDMDEVLAPWRARSVDRVAIMTLISMLVALMAYFLNLHVRRLNAARGSLLKSETSLRASEARFVSLFQHAPLPLAQIRLDNDQIVEVNQRWMRQMGYTREEVIGKTPMDIAIWVRPEERRAYLEQLRSRGEVIALETEFRKQDGSIFKCLLSSRLADIGGVETAIFAPIDVTEQREIEQRIRELNARLEERVLERTRNLEHANVELARALRSMQEMQAELLRSEKMAALGSLVAGVAHELNTPIGNGVTLASTLFDNARQVLRELESGKPRRSFVETSLNGIMQGANVLLRTLERAADLVHSFKQVAVDQSTDNRRRFKLGDLVHEILLTLETLYKKTHFRIEVEIDDTIEMESYPGAFAQVITNLVSNALGHAFDGRTEGLMRLAAQRIEDGKVCITFSDDGIGIAPENLGRVFDPFFTTKLGQGGSGLGMHILYNLVTNVLGGKVNLDSVVGEGTTVTMIVPLEAPALAPST